jgi:hypothetical protein
LLDFWQQAEEYRLLTEPAKRAERGALIYNTFFFKDSKFKIPENVLKKLKKKFDSQIFEPNMFSEVQYHVYQQLEKENFPAYVKDALCEDVLFNEEQPKGATSPKGSPEKGDGMSLPGQNFVNEEDSEPALRRKNSILQTEDHSSKPTNELTSGWYFGDLPRINAEQLLYAAGPFTFLVRTSSVRGCYALSLHFQEAFIHWIVQPQGNGYVLKDCPQDKEVYSSVEQLIANTPVLENFTASGSGLTRNEIFGKM